MGAVVENDTVFHLKKFAKFLINFKIIKIIIIKNKKYKNLKRLKGWPALPKGVAGHPIIGQGGGWSHPWLIWGGQTTLVGFEGGPATP
jgi:hypothetical protein